MLVNTYTLPQLVDLALRVPEIGAVNFNILHTVLRTLIQETGMHRVRPWCNIENPVVAQAALSTLKLKPPPLRKSFSEEFVPLDGEEFKVRFQGPDPPRPLTAEERYTRDTPGEETAREGPDILQIPDEEEPAVEQTEQEDAVTPEEEIETGVPDTQPEEKEPIPRVEPEVQRLAHPTSGADIMSGIDQGKQSQIMSEVWRATNVNRRMDAAEEGLQKLSYVVDRLVDRLNDMGSTTEEIQKHLENIRPQLHELVDDVAVLKTVTPTKDDIDAIKEQYTIIEGTKMDKAEFPTLLTETVLEEMPVFMDELDEKVEYVEGAVRCILDETGITYTPAPTHLIETAETVYRPLRHPSRERHVRRPKKEHKSTEVEAKVPSEQEQEEVEEEEEEHAPAEEEEFIELEEESPESEKEEEQPHHFVPVGRPTVENLNHRFENIWYELEMHKNLLMKLQKDEEEDHQEEEEKVHELERLLKKLNEDVDFVTIAIDSLDSEGKASRHAIEALQDAASELQYSKADKDEMDAALQVKADKRDVERKVERAEFEATVNDLGDAIEGLVGKLSSAETDFQTVTDDIYRELKLRLTIEDYKSLQTPMYNRLMALMYGFKNMKSLILRSVYPEAAGVTKCISCGRPAELAGTRFKETGDVPVPRRKNDDFDLKNLTTFDPSDSSGPSAGERSYMSFPSGSLSKNSSDSGSHLCEECEEKSKPGNSSESATFGSMSPMDGSYDRSTSTTAASNGGSSSTPRNVSPGLKRRKTRKETEEDFDKLLSTKPMTRFCGGEHTRTKPMQKGIVYTEQELPPRSREYKALYGYDNVWYKGATPGEKEGELPKGVDPRSLDVEELISYCQEAMPHFPPREYPEPRYCGGSHTTTDPQQRGLKFSSLRMSEEPVRRQTEVRARDGGVYKGISEDRNMDMRAARDSSRSSYSRKSNNTESRSGASACDMGRKLLKPNVVTITMDDKTINNSDSSRIRIVNLPRVQINRPMPSRFQSVNYAPSYTNSNNDYNMKRGKK